MSNTINASTPKAVPDGIGVLPGRMVDPTTIKRGLGVNNAMHEDSTVAGLACARKRLSKRLRLMSGGPGFGSSSPHNMRDGAGTSSTTSETEQHEAPPSMSAWLMEQYPDEKLSKSGSIVEIAYAANCSSSFASPSMKSQS